VPADVDLDAAPVSGAATSLADENAVPLEGGEREGGRRRRGGRDRHRRERREEDSLTGAAQTEASLAEPAPRAALTEGEPTFETRKRKGLFFAGQMSGVEGYVESAASGLVAGMGACYRALGKEPLALPEDTALGALGRYIAKSDPEHYQPTNIAFGLLPELPVRVKDKARKRMALAQRALASLEQFRAQLAAEIALPESEEGVASAAAGAELPRNEGTKPDHARSESATIARHPGTDLSGG